MAFKISKTLELIFSAVVKTCIKENCFVKSLFIKMYRLVGFLRYIFILRCLIQFPTKYFNSY